MTHTSLKRSRPCEDEDGGEFMPISKRINNLHIRSNSTLRNSDDEGQEETAAVVEQPRMDSCNEALPHMETHFLAGNSVSFPDTSLSQAAPSLSQGCGVIPAIYQNGHSQREVVFNGEAREPHYVLNRLENSVPSSSWTGDAAVMYLGHPPSYDPDLTEAQNPYYYHVNEMLYHLHVARIQRLAK